MKEKPLKENARKGDSVAETQQTALDALIQSGVWVVLGIGSAKFFCPVISSHLILTRDHKHLLYKRPSHVNPLILQDYDVSTCDIIIKSTEDRYCDLQSLSIICCDSLWGLLSGATSVHLHKPFNLSRSCKKVNKLCMTNRRATLTKFMVDFIFSLRVIRRYNQRFDSLPEAIK